MGLVLATLVAIVAFVLLAKLLIGVLAVAIGIGLGVVVYLGAEKLVGKGR